MHEYGFPPGCQRRRKIIRIITEARCALGCPIELIGGQMPAPGPHVFTEFLSSVWELGWTENNWVARLYAQWWSPLFQNAMEQRACVIARLGLPVVFISFLFIIFLHLWFYIIIFFLKDEFWCWCAILDASSGEVSRHCRMRFMLLILLALCGWNANIAVWFSEIFFWFFFSQRIFCIVAFLLRWETMRRLSPPLLLSLFFCLSGQYTGYIPCTCLSLKSLVDCFLFCFLPLSLFFSFISRCFFLSTFPFRSMQGFASFLLCKQAKQSSRRGFR